MQPAAGLVFCLASTPARTLGSIFTEIGTGRRRVGESPPVVVAPAHAEVAASVDPLTLPAAIT